MSLLDFIFRLGVMFAIYGFLWGLIEIAMWMLSGGRKRSIPQIYLIKAIKYFFLVDVTFLFCFDGLTTNMVVMNQVMLAGIILLTYFIGKLQKNQNKSMLFKFAGRGLPMQQNNFNMQFEVIIIALSLAIFATFWFYPEFSQNPISIWFKESIINIEDTPVFGFIFKVIGFFFLLNLIFKMANAFSFLLNGGKTPRDTNGPGNGDENKNDGGFVEYEEVE